MNVPFPRMCDRPTVMIRCGLLFPSFMDLFILRGPGFSTRRKPIR